MIKQYLPHENLTIWNPKTNSLHFKVKKNTLFQTNDVKIQKRCEELNYKFVKNIEEKVIIDVQVIDEEKEVVKKKVVKKPIRKKVK